MKTSFLVVLLSLAIFLVVQSQGQTVEWFDCPVFTNSVYNATAANATLTAEAAAQHHERAMRETLRHISQIHDTTFNLGPRGPIMTSKHHDAIFEDGNNVPTTAQCAYIPLPLGPGQTEKIFVFVKKLSPERNFGRTPKKQLWLLQGGPGGSSDSLEPQQLLMFKNLPDFEIFYIEHRGVGRSARIGCVGPQAETAGSDGGVSITSGEYPSCARDFKLNYGPAERTFFYSTTLAAQDLLDAIELTRGDKEVYVYGISYGTYWANRFMQLLDAAGKQIKAVILDGIVLPTGPKRTTMDIWDIKMNEVGEEFMKVCAEDAFCKSKLPGDASRFAQTVFEKLYLNNSCPAVTSVLSAASLRKILGNMLIQVNARNFIPALLFRLHRCDVDLDYGVLNFFLQQVNATTSHVSTCLPLYSPMLGTNIIIAELFNATKSLEQLQQIFNSSCFATDPAVQFKTLYADWPIYTPDQYFEKTFSTQSASVLLLNGNLDPQTPLEYAQIQYDLITAPLKQLVMIPFAPHYTVMRSPVNDSKIDCGMQLVFQFLNDPTQKVDTSCTQKVLPINYRGTDAANKLLFGVEDVFDGIYEAPEPERTINLYIFIGVEALTCVSAIIIICSLIYYAVKLREEQKQQQENYENIDNNN